MKRSASAARDHHPMTLLIYIALHVSAVTAAPLMTFGTGKSAFTLTSNETTVFDYTVSASATNAVLTHFWITGGTKPAQDNVTVRYYIDGEATPSIEFKPPMAAGVGFDDPAIFGTGRIAHLSNYGGWSNDFRVPFASTLRVTLALPASATPTTSWVIVRGTENLPVTVGPIKLPDTARLSLHKIDGVT